MCVREAGEGRGGSSMLVKGFLIWAVLQSALPSEAIPPRSQPVMTQLGYDSLPH